MMTIRRAICSDATELKRLNDLFNGDDSNTAEAIVKSLGSNKNEIVCVADAGDRLAGYCCGQIQSSMCYSYDYAVITELFVMNAYRLQGVGRRLFEFTEHELIKRGITHFHLSTGFDNSAAQSLYRSCGYTDTSVMFEKDVKK